MSVAINRRRLSGERSASYRRLEYISLAGGAVTNGFTLDYKIHRSDKISIRFLLDERDVINTALYPLVINRFVYDDPNNFFISSYRISGGNQNCDLIRIADTWYDAKSGFTHMFSRGKTIYDIYIDLPNNTVRLNNGRVTALNPGGQNTNDSRLYDSDGYTLGDVVIFNTNNRGSFPARFYEFKVEGKSYIYPILDENNVVCLYDEIRDRKYYTDGNVFQAGPYYVAMPQTYDYETEYVKFEAAGASAAPNLYFYNLPADGYLTCDFTFDAWGSTNNGWPIAFKFEVYDTNAIADRTVMYEESSNHRLIFEKGASSYEINVTNVTLPYRVQKTKLRYHVKANDYGVTTKYVGVCMGAPITFREFKVYDLNDNLCLDLQPVSVLGIGQLWDKVNNVFGDAHGTVDLIAGPAKS